MSSPTPPERAAEGLRGHADAARRRDASPWRNPWVLGWIGLVVAVLLANLTMVLLAVHTNPGLVVADYYEKGRQYAETRSAQRLVQPDGWEVRLDLPERVMRGQPASIRVAARDVRGLPVRADAATLFAYRPSDAGADFQAALTPHAPGISSVEVVFPLAGIWDLIVQVRAGEQVYDTARRLAVDP
jgi:nitrogen fixation protein FixH